MDFYIVGIVNTELQLDTKIRQKEVILLVIIIEHIQNIMSALHIQTIMKYWRMLF